MGLYDSIMVACPKCGYRNEFQTKSGPCELNTYNFEDAPADALIDVNRHAPAKCHVCDTMYSAPEPPSADDTIALLTANVAALTEDLAKQRAAIESFRNDRDIVIERLRSTIAERDSARAEAEKMRPVYEAAKVWLPVWRRAWKASERRSPDPAYMFVPEEVQALIAAISTALAQDEREGESNG